jgi:hypothetical protein
MRAFIRGDGGQSNGTRRDAPVPSALASDPDVVSAVGGSGPAFGRNTHWVALRHSPTSPDYKQVYVAETMPKGILRISLMRTGGVTAPILVVALEDGYDEILSVCGNDTLFVYGFFSSWSLTGVGGQDIVVGQMAATN